MMSDPIQVLLRVVDILDELKIPYLVGGSIASSILGEPRSTEDIGIVADIREEHVPQLLSMMQGEFYIDEGAVREAIRHRSSFNVIQLESMRKVDLFVLSDQPINREEMRRRRLTVIEQNSEKQIYNVLLAIVDYAISADPSISSTLSGSS